MSLFVDGPCGLLEAEVWEPERRARAAAVVCHPHPLHGGDMNTTPVSRAARGLRAAGLVVLRFNFRGVGRSEGEHDGGGGEEEDARAALDWLAERRPDLQLWAAGYSFGARTLLGLTPRDERIRRLVLIALPVAVLDCSGIERIERPGLVVQAGDDDFGNRAALEARHPHLYPGLELAEIAGTDHLFRGRTRELQNLVEDTATRWLEAQHEH